MDRASKPSAPPFYLKFLFIGLNIIMIKDDIYTAGLIDGEGSIMLNKRTEGKSFRFPCVSMSSTSYELLKFMQNQYGEHICNHKSYKKYHKQSWVWRVRNQAAINLLTKIVSYLKEETKLSRAKFIVEKYPMLTVRTGKYNLKQIKAKLKLEEDFHKIGNSNNPHLQLQNNWII